MDDMAWGDVDADGALTTRSLDIPVATARGAENLFIANPMDAHDWSHTSVVRNSLNATLKAHLASQHSAKVKLLEEAMRPIFFALPKDANGRLKDGVARYALHRHFSKKHGWSIKGLEPAGAGWVSTMSVTPDVKDITKYMVPSYLQQQLAKHLGVAGCDLHSLAILAAVIEHMVHAEMQAVVYSIFATLELPVPGKRTKTEVGNILDTFLMVYAFGINLDVSMLRDVQNAKVHLEKSHSGWPKLRLFADQVKDRTSLGSELDFAQIVQVAEKISERYAQYQGQDCRRAKDVLTAKPSHSDGRVKLAEVEASHARGSRSLFTEDREDLERLGVLSEGGVESESQLIISNYVNSQAMCLSTASLYTVCCTNECNSLLEGLERDVGGPTVALTQLENLLAALPGPRLSEAVRKDLASLGDPEEENIRLHSRAFAGWMHKAFPLECPAPHNKKITNPKTPDEWTGESGLIVHELEDMMGEIALTLAKYTSMGKETRPKSTANQEEVPDSSNDVIVVHPVLRQLTEPQGSGFVAMSFRLSAMASMMVVVAFAGKSALQATGSRTNKVSKDWTSAGTFDA